MAGQEKIHSIDEDSGHRFRMDILSDFAAERRNVYSSSVTEIVRAPKERNTISPINGLRLIGWCLVL